MTALSILGSKLVDGTGTDPTGPTTVTIESERITAITAGPAGPGSGEVLDAEGLTLMPGIINAHSHLGGVTFADTDETAPAVVAAWIYEHCRRSLELGITTCRETGSIDGGVVHALEAGILPGPRIVPAGPAIVQMGGHGDFRPAYVADPCHHHIGVPGLAVLTVVADGPDAVRAAARLAFKRGAKFLKVMVSGGVTSLTDSLEDTQYTVEELRAAADEARARRTYVTAHTHNNEGIRRGLEAGIECFEHGTALDEETAKAMAAAGAALVPTLTVAHLYRENAGFLPQSVIDRIGGVEAGMRRAIHVARDAGILVGCGADLIGPDQKRWNLEVALVAEEVGGAQAIRTATLDNARVLRMADHLGSIESGKIADLIAVDGDPVAEPLLLDDPERIKVVIQSGRVVKDIR